MVQYTYICHILAFLDGTDIVGCVSKGDKLEYREVIKNFVIIHSSYPSPHQHQQNKGDGLSQKRTQITPVNTQGFAWFFCLNNQSLDVETVVRINNKLESSVNTGDLYRWGQSYLHIQRRLKSFGVCRTLLKHQSVISSDDVSGRNVVSEF